MKNLIYLFTIVLLLSACGERSIEIAAKVVSCKSTLLTNDGFILCQATVPNGDTINARLDPKTYWGFKMPIYGKISYVASEVSFKYFEPTNDIPGKLSVTVVNYSGTKAGAFYRCFAQMPNGQEELIFVSEKDYLENKIPFKGLSKINEFGRVYFQSGRRSK